ATVAELPPVVLSLPSSCAVSSGCLPPWNSVLRRLERAVGADPSSSTDSEMAQHPVVSGVLGP
ncbi:MAG: hypothetical protein OK454_07800, partial [Thaumarchaeota archaeon]|nr:hypothetical protein [Nitrososphaerota archaeon]